MENLPFSLITSAGQLNSKKQAMLNMWARFKQHFMIWVSSVSNHFSFLSIFMICIISQLKILLGVDFLQANDPYCRDSKFVGTLDLSKCTSFHTKSKLSLPLVMSKAGFQIGAH